MMKTFKSGELIQRLEYQSFEPALINRQWEMDDTSMLNALSKADRQIGRLDMFSEYVPDLDLFIRMHITKEANKSSRIEGTQTEFEEALLPEEEVLLERRDDWHEVNNYITAMNHALEALGDIPFSNRLLQDSHAILMQGVRGEQKTPGEYRLSQNWIGGSNPSNARFVPPHQENVSVLMGDLEMFAHNSNIEVPELIKIGIMHYQFETIHPFLDGNGRIGRLMIPLYLISKGILKQPVLYLSDYLERHRDEYYERLTRVREHNDLAGWLHFFLDGISETAESGIQTFDKILQFQRHWEAEIASWKPKSAHNLTFFKTLFQNPIVSANKVASLVGVSQPSAYNLINRFTDCGLLKELTGQSRGKLYGFDAYLALYK